MESLPNVKIDQPQATTRKRAVVTGGSSGIGQALANELAARDTDLILVARNESRLAVTAKAIQQEHGVAVQTVVADLSTDEGIKTVEQIVSQVDRLDVLINCAGYVTKGYFADIGIERHIAMELALYQAPMRIISAILPLMRQQHEGAIINISSIGAYIPSVNNTTYSAMKAALVAASKSLHLEYQQEGIKVMVVIPGFTHTNIYNNDDFNGGKDILNAIPKFMWMSPEKVAKGTLRALTKNKDEYIPGIANKLLIFISKFVPPSLFQTSIRRIKK